MKKVLVILFAGALLFVVNVTFATDYDTGYNQIKAKTELATLAVLPVIATDNDAFNISPGGFYSVSVEKLKASETAVNFRLAEVRTWLFDFNKHFDPGRKGENRKIKPYNRYFKKVYVSPEIVRLL